MAMALVLAPHNKAHIFYWLGLWFGTTSCSIRVVATLYLGFELLSCFLYASSGTYFSSSMLHLLGAAVGFPLGIILLKRGDVDCEGWDLFSLRNGRPREVKLYQDDEVT
jgi:hypothetical protein